jgi:hypothetical protein
MLVEAGQLLRQQLLVVLLNSQQNITVVAGLHEAYAITYTEKEI